MRVLLHATDGLGRIREATAPLHAGVEQRSALPGSLQDVGDVVGLLQRWATLLTRLDPATGPWVDDDVRRTIHADICGLGGDPPPASPCGPTVDDPAAQLGTAWVLHGARIGLASMQRHVTTVTGRPLGTFDGPDVTVLTRIRAGIRDLDGDDLDAAVAAATAAFQTAALTIGGPPWQT